MTECRVLIVDDSRVMRQLIAHSLSRDPEIVIVGEAADPFEAREAIKALDPDVVTLDIEMPRMNGLVFLERIIRLRPTRVVILSSLTHASAEIAKHALEIGAVDCMGKPTFSDASFGERLAARVRAAAAAPLPSRVTDGASNAVETHDARGLRPLVAIGASMGGVDALSSILSAFPEDCPPTVIVQHMPASFTRSLADRLNKTSRPRVREAFNDLAVTPGNVLIAPGGSAHLEIAVDSVPRCRLVDRPLVSGHRPSVDVLFQSVARSVGRNSVGVVLTGMGRDGAAGLLEMRRQGARTFAQDEASCLVYGMPRAAVEMGAAQHELPLAAIGPKIIEMTRTSGE